MKEGIKVSSVDLVMFTWLHKLEDRELESDDEGEDGKGVQEDQGQEDEDVEAAFARLTAGTSGKPVEIGTRHYSNATIWIGVTPDRLNGARAFELTTQIRAYLDTRSHLEGGHRFSRIRRAALAWHRTSSLRPCRD